MKNIFVVMATTSYEGSDPVRSFEDPDEAEAFAQKCRDHEAKHKQCPDDLSDAAWAKWDAHDKRWEATHPAKPFIGREAYHVVTLKFKARTTPKEGK